MQQASALVMTRAVIAGENIVIQSAAEKVLSSTEFRLRGQKTHPWVSRGGVKLAHAVEHFGVDLNGGIPSIVLLVHSAMSRTDFGHQGRLRSMSAAATEASQTFFSTMGRARYCFPTERSAFASSDVECCGT